MKPQIFVFVIGTTAAGWLRGRALSEDGNLLAVSVSHDRRDFRADMGLDSERQHQLYRAHYNDGYQLVEVADDEVPTHPGLAEALALWKAWPSRNQAPRR